MNIQYQFQGKTALVTGGAQGIGFEIARTFLDAGARVAIWDYSDGAIEAAKALVAPKPRMPCLSRSIS
jgi:3-oxoacyl-[acyl-carrier protein] reductase